MNLEACKISAAMWKDVVNQAFIKPLNIS